MTYRHLQAELKAYREQGYELPCKLNATKAELAQALHDLELSIDMEAEIADAQLEEQHCEEHATAIEDPNWQESLLVAAIVAVCTMVLGLLEELPVLVVGVAKAIYRAGQLAGKLWELEGRSYAGVALGCSLLWLAAVASL